jgi:hypothetical protein
MLITSYSFVSNKGGYQSLVSCSKHIKMTTVVSFEGDRAPVLRTGRQDLIPFIGNSPFDHKVPGNARVTSRFITEITYELTWPATVDLGDEKLKQPNTPTNHMEPRRARMSGPEKNYVGVALF